MMQGLSLELLAAQAMSLVGLGLCIAGFASKRDEWLLVLLIAANVAFAVHFVLFTSWTAAALTLLIIVRIALARRYKGSRALMTLMLGLSLLIAVLTWQGPRSVFPLLAAALGTIAMFELQGISMRIFLGGAALAWMMNNLLIGSIGGTLTEGIILATNIVTIVRLMRHRRRGSPHRRSPSPTEELA